MPAITGGIKTESADQILPVYQFFLECISFLNDNIMDRKWFGHSEQ